MTTDTIDLPAGTTSYAFAGEPTEVFLVPPHVAQMLGLRIPDRDAGETSCLAGGHSNWVCSRNKGHRGMCAAKTNDHADTGNWLIWSARAWAARRVDERLADVKRAAERLERAIAHQRNCAHLA